MEIDKLIGPNQNSRPTENPSSPPPLLPSAMSYRLSTAVEDEVEHYVKRAWQRYDRHVTDSEAKQTILRYVHGEVCHNMERDRATRMGPKEDDTIHRLMHRAAELARYYEPDYRELGDSWEMSSTASAGSSGSHGSGLPEIRLHQRIADTVFQ